MRIKIYVKLCVLLLLGAVTSSQSMEVKEKEQELKSQLQRHIPDAPIYFRGELEAKKQADQYTLFSSMTAFINLVSEYYDFFLKDKNLEGTYANYPVYLDRERVLGLDEQQYIYIDRVPSLKKSDADIPPCIFSFEGSKIYEVQRQMNLLTLFQIRNLVIWWRRLIFPKNDPRFYVETKAHALLPLMKHFYIINQESIQKASEQDTVDRAEIKKTLGDSFKIILDNVPQKTHMIGGLGASSKRNMRSNKNIEKQIKTKKTKYNNLTNKLTKEYEPSFANSLDTIKLCNYCFKSLIERPNFIAAYYQRFVKMFQGALDRFKASQRYPIGRGEYLRFRNVPVSDAAQFLEMLNICRAKTIDLPLEWVLHDINDEKAEISFDQDETQMNRVEEKTTPAIEDDLSLKDQAKDTELEEKEKEFDKPFREELSPEDKSDKAEFETKENLPEKEKINEEESEAIDLDYDAFLREEHRRHQALKAEIKKLSKKDSNLNVYEEKLYRFLSDNIFHANTKLTHKRLKKHLKKLSFYVAQNSKGKGSLFHIGPLPDNPLFGQHLVYKDAFFNVHLPHLPSEQIPYSYFRYLQSGFSHVFGLTKESVDNEKDTVCVPPAQGF